MNRISFLSLLQSLHFLDMRISTSLETMTDTQRQGLEVVLEVLLNRLQHAAPAATHASREGDQAAVLLAGAERGRCP